MKTIINIGTDKKNIVGVEIDKPFDEIGIEDIWKIVEAKFGSRHKIHVHGWCDVTNSKK